jgi:transcriptional antiterminator
MDIQSSKMTYAFKLKPQALNELQSATLEWQLKMGMELLFTSLNPDYENWIRSGLIHDYFGYDIEINTDYWYAMFYGESEDKEAFVNLIDRVLSSDIRPLLPYLKQLKRRYLSYTYRLMDDQDDYAIHYLRNAFFKLSIEDTIRIIDELSEEAVLEAMETLKTNQRSVVVIKKA